jgi:hypothetical protein
MAHSKKTFDGEVAWLYSLSNLTLPRQQYEQTDNRQNRGSGRRNDPPEQRVDDRAGVV